MPAELVRKILEQNPGTRIAHVGLTTNASGATYQGRGICVELENPRWARNSQRVLENLNKLSHLPRHVERLGEKGLNFSTMWWRGKPRVGASFGRLNARHAGEVDWERLSGLSGKKLEEAMGRIEKPFREPKGYPISYADKKHEKRIELEYRRLKLLQQQLRTRDIKLKRALGGGFGKGVAKQFEALDGKDSKK
ncbi:MAG: hypothetical protein WC792_06185 [Candidatus Micrarchaeia archaeon]|jgi:hypothetical protein